MQSSEFLAMLSSWRSKYYTVLAFFIIFLILFLIIIAFLVFRLKKSGSSGWLAGQPTSPGPRCWAGNGDDDVTPLTPRDPPTHHTFKFDDNGNEGIPPPPPPPPSR